MTFLRKNGVYTTLKVHFIEVILYNKSPLEANIRNRLDEDDGIDDRKRVNSKQMV